MIHLGMIVQCLAWIELRINYPNWSIPTLIHGAFECGNIQTADSLKWPGDLQLNDIQDVLSANALNSKWKQGFQQSVQSTYSVDLEMVGSMYHGCPTTHR